MSSKDKTAKTRIERKLYFAQGIPEPIFDISGCELTEIPRNVFPLCRVLRKEALYLDRNSLTDLASGGSLAELKNIKVLNMSVNKLKKLPNSIYELESLQVLDASNNNLVELPETFGGLRNLISLNLSYNDLVKLPDSIGNCRSLEVINLTYNENLNQLPVTMGKLQLLSQLEIDSTITYPPKYICNQGTHGIIKFLSKELKEDEEIPTTSAQKSTTSHFKYDILKEKIQLYEQLKQVRQSERMLLEKQLMDQNQKEVEKQEKIKEDKKKLLKEVQSQQENLEAELERLQDRKTAERCVLFQLCQEEERRLNDIAKKLTGVNRTLQLQYSKEWEEQRNAEEKMLLSNLTASKALERKAILDSMEKLMTEESLRAQERSAAKKLNAIRSMATAISKEDEQRAKVMKQRGLEIQNLLDKLRENEELQKSAVAALLQKSDNSWWELTEQIRIVEGQLSELTRLELAKRQLEMHRNLEELAKNRAALTELLEQLLEEQKAKRKELVDTMRKMEIMRESTKNTEMFWLEQFNKLLNSKRHEMVQFFESVSPKLVYELYINGVFHYLPLLKDVSLSEDNLRKLNHDGLKKCGINNNEDRTKILRAVKSYLDAEFPDKTPSAPAMEEDLSTSEAVSSSAYIVPDECVICLETKPAVIFAPCGHLCCCSKCSAPISVCPLCRTPINKFLKRSD